MSRGAERAPWRRGFVILRLGPSRSRAPFKLINVSIVRPTELGAGELTAWRGMQTNSVGFDNPFLSPGFAVAVGRVRPSARVAVIEDGGSVAGFFPFEIAGLRVGSAICARLSDAQAVVHREDFEWDARDLLKRCKLDVWEFRRLIEAQWSGAGRCVSRPRRSPIIDLASGFDHYAAQHSSTVKKIRAQRRRLQRDTGSVHFELQSSDPAALRLLLQWKSAQYRRTGRWDRLSEQWVVSLLEDLFENPSEGCVAVLSALHAGNRIAALHLGLRTSTTFSYWFPTYDPAGSRYSPGLILLLMIMEAAPASGLGRLDLGVGEDEYKRRLMTGELQVAEGWFERPSPIVLMRRAGTILRRARSRLSHVARGSV
jgi:CelD/BcsL family acetyltransferase involved in cellulose biosynthesis